MIKLRQAIVVEGRYDKNALCPSSRRMASA